MNVTKKDVLVHYSIDICAPKAPKDEIERFVRDALSSMLWGAANRIQNGNDSFLLSQCNELTVTMENCRWDTQFVLRLTRITDDGLQANGETEASERAGIATCKALKEALRKKGLTPTS